MAVARTRIDSDVRIDGERLVRRLLELGAVGAIEGTTGCSRLALTDADRDGRNLVVTWMRDLGLEVSIDAIGNVIATTRHAPGAPPVMMGSHIDTVGTGGRYDGCLGVLAGLEVIETVLTAGVDLQRPLAVAFFTDEEGARFAPDMLGSLVYVGGMGVEEALAIQDATGVLVGDELDRIDYRGPAPVPGPAPYAYVELHIEQGPLLEAGGEVIGVVESVQGISWTELTLTGQSAHAGTTPMHLRHDPLVVAAQITNFVRELSNEIGGAQVGTVGVTTPTPNLTNVIPSTVRLTVDLRNTDEAVLQDAERRVADFVSSAAAAEGVTVETHSLARFEPVLFDPRVVDLVEQIAGQHALAHRRMPSGAGHDAQMLARVCPAGMIFVPSVRGLSHNVNEYTAPEHIAAGANVLLDVVVALANEASPADNGARP